MHHNTFEIYTSDDNKIFVQEFVPEKSPRAVILLVHGIGEHSSRYTHWAQLFVNNDIAMVAYDQRGHGLSTGKRGVISSYKDFMNDIDALLNKTSIRFKGVPIFLYGHSMGGGEVLNHLIHYEGEYVGVISTSPWIITQAAPPKFAISLLRILNKLMPYAAIKTKFDSSMLSHDPDVARRYDKDPLVHHKVGFRLFIEAYDIGYSIYNSSSKFDKPLLLLHGGGDKITDPTASRHFAENHSEKCTFKMWPEMYHELHNESCQHDVFQVISHWINSQLH